jgi:hypothetical protein
MGSAWRKIPAVRQRHYAKPIRVKVREVNNKKAMVKSVKGEALSGDGGE